MSKRLKRGYTTGVHASFAFKLALESFLMTKSCSRAITHKMDNDDLDVTKGCEIIVTISDKKEDLKLNPIEHKPYIIENLKLYAGVGVGIVTKEGLKPPKGFPAINPTPLNAIEQIYRRCDHVTHQNIYATISVTNGKEIAKRTANAKVGVVDGISILGTTGFVKPISSLAYIDSIRTELNVAKANGYNQAVLTLGNSSLIYAKESYNEIQIVEIGNFVYDSLAIVQELKFQSAIFICGIGKATKVMQGYRNTHNRFGSIDLVVLKKQIKDELEVDIDIKSTKTVKGISAQFETADSFYKMIKQNTQKKLSEWFKRVDIDIRILR